MGDKAMDKADRIALFQQWFSDTIPHNKALGLKVVDARRGFAVMELPWRDEFVGNPETGVLAGGPLTAMLDGCCGMAVATMLKNLNPSRRSTCGSTMCGPPNRASR